MKSLENWNRRKKVERKFNINVITFACHTELTEELQRNTQIQEELEQKTKGYKQAL